MKEEVIEELVSNIQHCVIMGELDKAKLLLETLKVLLDKNKIPTSGTFTHTPYTGTPNQPITLCRNLTDTIR